MGFLQVALGSVCSGLTCTSHVTRHKLLGRGCVFRTLGERASFLALVVALRAGVGSSPDSEIPFCLRAKRNQKRALNTHGGTHAAPTALCSNSRRESVLGRCVRHFALLVPFASAGGICASLPASWLGSRNRLAMLLWFSWGERCSQNFMHWDTY